MLSDTITQTCILKISIYLCCVWFHCPADSDNMPHVSFFPPSSPAAWTLGPGGDAAPVPAVVSMETNFMKPGEDVLIDQDIENKRSDGGWRRRAFGSWCQKLTELGACLRVCSWSSWLMQPTAKQKNVDRRHEGDSSPGAAASADVGTPMTDPVVAVNCVRAPSWWNTICHFPVMNTHGRAPWCKMRLSDQLKECFLSTKTKLKY